MSSSSVSFFLLLLLVSGAVIISVESFTLPNVRSGASGFFGGGRNSDCKKSLRTYVKICRVIHEVFVEEQCNLDELVVFDELEICFTALFGHICWTCKVVEAEKT